MVEATYPASKLRHYLLITLQSVLVVDFAPWKRVKASKSQILVSFAEKNLVVVFLQSSTLPLSNHQNARGQLSAFTWPFKLLHNNNDQFTPSSSTLVLEILKLTC